MIPTTINLSTEHLTVFETADIRDLKATGCIRRLVAGLDKHENDFRHSPPRLFLLPLLHHYGVKVRVPSRDLAQGSIAERFPAKATSE
jgi:hypothetical protein